MHPQVRDVSTSCAPAVVWFTGLSGAGKSTIARQLCRVLAERGVRVEYLDGDELRALSPELGFSRAERDAHVTRAGALASRLERDGAVVVCALVSPYADARAQVRSLCRRFVEVHVATPLSECERRDPKGLYAKVRRGELKQFTGVDDPYEPPDAPEVTIDTRSLTPDQAVRLVLHALSLAVPG